MQVSSKVGQLTRECRRVFLGDVVPDDLHRKVAELREGYYSVYLLY